MTNSPSRLTTFFVAAALVAISACTQRPLYYNYAPLPSEGWNARDTLRFLLPTTEETAAHSLSIGVRATDRITYRDLWLVAETRRTPIDAQECSPQSRERDTIHVLLASDRGHWHTSGVVLHETEQFCTNITTSPHYSTQILIYHIMATQDIKGLSEIGVKVQ